MATASATSAVHATSIAVATVAAVAAAYNEAVGFQQYVQEPARPIVIP